MKKFHITLILLFFSSHFFAQNIVFEDLEKNIGQYYTNIESVLLSNKFDFLNYDSNKKKITYQFQPENYLSVGNKYCYVWRSNDDKAKIIAYVTTDYNEYIEWKKAIMLKGYKSKPAQIEIDGTQEWFYTKRNSVKVLKKQVPAAEKGKKMIMYVLSIVNEK